MYVAVVPVLKDSSSISGVLLSIFVFPTFVIYFLNAKSNVFGASFTVIDISLFLKSYTAFVESEIFTPVTSYVVPFSDFVTSTLSEFINFL